MTRWAAAAIGAAAAAASAMPLAAHEGAPVAPHDVWGAWSVEPLVVAGLVGAGWMYARGVRAAWRVAGKGRGIAGSHVAAFAGAMATLVLALISPIDALGGTLFSAHMVQHLLLVLAAAPLVVLAVPDRAFTWALPVAARRAAGRWVNRPGVRAAAAVATRPLAAWTLHAAAVWIWHAPAPYTAALRSDAVHAAEHASFLATALLFWWVVLRPHGRPRAYGTSVLLVFGTALHSGALGALITFAGASWYPAHAAGAALWGMSALEDQQLAGLLMWIPAGLVYLGAAGVLCTAWLAPPMPRSVRVAG